MRSKKRRDLKDFIVKSVYWSSEAQVHVWKQLC